LNILITGGAGYVGSVVIPQLIEDGHHIKCLDRFFFGNKPPSSLYSKYISAVLLKSSPPS
jgi:nucleoside-diphosphate-sugar epimerase